MEITQYLLLGIIMLLVSIGNLCMFILETKGYDPDCTDPPNMRQKEIRELVEKNGNKWARNLEKWGFVDKPFIFW